MNTFKDLIKTQERLEQYDKDIETKYYKGTFFNVLFNYTKGYFLFYVILPLSFYLYALYF